MHSIKMTIHLCTQTMPSEYARQRYANYQEFNSIVDYCLQSQRNFSILYLDFGTQFLLHISLLIFVQVCFTMLNYHYICIATSDDFLDGQYFLFNIKTRCCYVSRRQPTSQCNSCLILLMCCGVLEKNQEKFVDSMLKKANVIIT